MSQPLSFPAPQERPLQPARCDVSAAPRVQAGVEPTDATLVGRSRAGDLDAFALLIDRYRDGFLRYARNMLGNREDAEDVVQEVFIRAYRALGKSEPTRFGAWAFRILVNRCRTAFRRREVSRRVFSDRDINLMATPAESRASGWLDGQREELDRALARLPVEQREAFLLKHVDELSYTEMEGVTGASVPALKMRVSRACDRLRTLLEPDAR